MQTYYWKIKDDIMTIYDSNRRTVADISECSTKSTDVAWLVEETLYNMGYIGEAEEVNIYPYDTDQALYPYVYDENGKLKQVKKSTLDN